MRRSELFEPARRGLPLRVVKAAKTAWLSRPCGSCGLRLGDELVPLVLRCRPSGSFTRRPGSGLTRTVSSFL